MQNIVSEVLHEYSMDVCKGLMEGRFFNFKVYSDGMYAAPLALALSTISSGSFQAKFLMSCCKGLYLLIFYCICSYKNLSFVYVKPMN